MLHGWRGKLLRIDLTRRRAHIEEIALADLRHWMGGKGLAGHYLREKITLPFDDPRMPILMFTGPLVGTSSPTSGRMTVMTRSPLTGTVGDASVGGKLGTQIKRAGFDGIIVEGAADQWTGVEIFDDVVKFEEAGHLTGLTISAATRSIRPQGALAMIGPAAEVGVRFSSLIVDGHFAAARGGVGLTFGAKKLKYITVAGTGVVEVCDRDLLRHAREDIERLMAASPVLLGEHGIANFGTPALYDLMHVRRMMPTHNFRETRFEPARDLGAYALHARYDPKKTGCTGCGILCKKQTRDGRALPEFETLSHFTALIGNDNLDAAFEANLLCNELGMDTISAAVSVACYAEIEGCSLDGVKLLELLEEIGRGRGEGRTLGAGSRAYAASKGAAHLSMSVKGQELPAYDPRGAYGMALAYATSTRGGCHLRAYPISHEILRKPVVTDRFSFSGKARIIKHSEDQGAVVDSLVACKFIFLACGLEEYAEAFYAVTGEGMSASELARIGERICYHERLMNHLNGFGSADDDLPRRFFEEAGTGGSEYAVPPIDRRAFLEARAAYYHVRGLDEHGRPIKSVADELGVPWNVS